MGRRTGLVAGAPSSPLVNLAIVSETFPPEVNGVAMTFGVITRELARRGHTVTVYRPRRPDCDAREQIEGVREVALPGFAVPGYPLIRLGWPAGGRLRRAWTGTRPDLVHVVTEGPLGASGVTVARALGIPVTSSYHTNFHQYAGAYGFAPLRGITLAWLRRLHNRTRLTFAPTVELVDALSGLGFNNVQLLSRGIDTWQFHPARRSPELRPMGRGS
jgi:glycosyltransferase involved in cell wall biosynthesis